MAIALVLAFMLTPPTKMFVDNITSRTLWSELQQRLVPRERWFGIDWRATAWLPDFPFHAKTQVVPANTSPITTGSIPSPASATGEK
jgi:hypothetical protein